MFYGNDAFGLDDLAAAETQQQAQDSGTPLFQPGDISNILNTASQNAQQWMQWETQRKAALTPQAPAPRPSAPAPSPVQQPSATPWGKIAVGVAVAGVAIFGVTMLMKKRKTAENPRKRARNCGEPSGSWQTIGE